MSERSIDRTANPDDALEASREETDGRPTGPTDEDGLRAGQHPQDAPTEAPEEHGADTPTEHAPGGDL